MSYYVKCCRIYSFIISTALSHILELQTRDALVKYLLASYEEILQGSSGILSSVHTLINITLHFTQTQNADNPQVGTSRMNFLLLSATLAQWVRHSSMNIEDFGSVPGTCTYIVDKMATYNSNLVTGCCPKWKARKTSGSVVNGYL